MKNRMQEHGASNLQQALDRMKGWEHTFDEKIISFQQKKKTKRGLGIARKRQDWQGSPG